MKNFYRMGLSLFIYGVTYTISHAADIQFPNADIDSQDKIAIKHALHVFHEYDSPCSPDQSHTPYFSLMTITHEWDQGFIRSLKKNWTFQNIIGETGLHQLNILWSSLMGTLAYHPEKNILVIAYRGSRQKSDYINNFNPGRRSLENANTQFALHAGYAHAFEHSKNSLLPSLNTILTSLSEGRSSIFSSNGSRCQKVYARNIRSPWQTTSPFG